MKLGIIFVSLGLVLLGAILIASLVFDNSEWPTTNGVVSFAKVRSKNQRGTGTVYFTDLNYQYTVDGKLLNGNKISWMEPVYPNESSARQAAPYTEGQQVKVYYDPSNPSRSFLKPGMTVGMHLFVCPGILLAVGGCSIASDLIGGGRRTSQPG